MARIVGLACSWLLLVVTAASAQRIDPVDERGVYRAVLESIREERGERTRIEVRERHVTDPVRQGLWAELRDEGSLSTRCGPCPAGETYVTVDLARPVRTGRDTFAIRVDVYQPEGGFGGGAEFGTREIVVREGDGYRVARTEPLVVGDYIGPNERPAPVPAFLSRAEIARIAVTALRVAKGRWPEADRIRLDPSSRVLGASYETVREGAGLAPPCPGRCTAGAPYVWLAVAGIHLDPDRAYLVRTWEVGFTAVGERRRDEGLTYRVVPEAGGYAVARTDTVWEVPIGEP